MKFTQDQSEIKYKNMFKAGGYKKPKKMIKPIKPTVNQIFDVGCNKKCNKKCKCKK
jgi:hypothetical protein